jgi:2-dehydropantoate 2-reductase
MSDDAYDLIMVLVRRNQLFEVLPRLSDNRYTPSILFMLNNATGPNEIVAALGWERVLLGFPGAGGTREGNAVRATILFGVLQPTSLGELDGHSTPRVRQLARILKSAGFPTVIRKNMDAWLKTHAGLVSPIANAIYMTDGNIHQLAHDRESVRLMLQAMREGFQVLHSLHIPITPFKMRILELIPEPLIVSLLQRLLDTEYAELIIARHANAARDEMKQIADEFRVLAHDSSLPTPSIDRLYSFV